MLKQNDQGGSYMASNAIFFFKILIFIMYLVSQFLFKSSDFDMNVP